MVVEPTHLKNMLVKMGSSSPNFGMKIKKIFEVSPPSDVFFLVYWGIASEELENQTHDSHAMHGKWKFIQFPEANGWQRVHKKTTWLAFTSEPLQ